jgi:hypothetical protein
MAIFRPPTDDFVYWTDLYDFSPESRLFARLRNGARGRNVYKLVDGGYTENQPAYFEDIEKIYLGGHDNVLTAEEEADLIAAGYGDFIEAQ